MVRITFTSGHEREFDYEWNKVTPKLLQGGIRLWAPYPGIVIPLNSSTIAMVEFEEDDVMDGDFEIEIEMDEDEEETVDETVEEEDEPTPKKSIEEKKEEFLAETKAKANCKHENTEIYYQEVKTGSRTAQKIARRYFPVCTFCGLRERYVKADSLTDEQRANAKIWDK